MVSRNFPATHNRKGEETGFVEQILNELIPCGLVDSFTVNKHNINSDFLGSKLHTMRANKKGDAYKRWSKKIKEVQEGRAILSLRYWSGSSYNYQRDGSKQIEFAQLDKDSGVGVQKFKIQEWFDEDDQVERAHYLIDSKPKQMLLTRDLAKNDGLSEADFREWFKGYHMTKEMAIIHFTKFRY